MYKYLLNQFMQIKLSNSYKHMLLINISYIKNNPKLYKDYKKETNKLN